MRPVTLTQTGAGNTLPCPMDVRLVPFNVGLQAWITANPSPTPSPSPSPGADGYVVETTDSDVWALPQNLLWTLHPSFVDSGGTEVPKTENWIGNLAFPATAVRLRVTGGDLTVQLRIVQSGF